MRSKTPNPFKTLQNLFLSPLPLAKHALYPRSPNDDKELSKQKEFLSTTMLSTPSRLKTLSFKAEKTKCTQEFKAERIQTTSDEDYLLSEKKAREDMKSTCMINILSRHNRKANEKKVLSFSPHSFSSLEPNLNQDTLNSILNQNIYSTPKEPPQLKPFEQNPHNAVPMILLKNEINKKLLKTIIRRKIKQTHDPDRSLDFLQNFKVCQNVANWSVALKCIKTQEVEYQGLNLPKKNNMEDVSFAEIEELTARIEEGDQKILSIRAELKGIRLRHSILTVRVKDHLVENERVQRKFERKIKEVKELASTQNPIDSPTIGKEASKNEKPRELANFMKIRQIEDEKAKLITKIKTNILNYRKEIETLRARINQCEHDISSFKKKKDLCLLDLKSKIKAFLSKEQENLDFVKLFKIFLRANMKDFTEVLAPSFPPDSIDFYLECAKKNLEIEDLVRQKKSLHKTKQSLGEFFQRVEERCKKIKYSFEKTREIDDMRSNFAKESENSNENYQSRLDQRKLFDLKLNRKKNEIQLKISDIEEQLKFLNEKYKKSQEIKKKFKSFHK